MKDDLELCQLVYQVLLTMIRFGTYRHGDKLPKIESAAGQLLVSQDTVRTAYLRLKQEGYISLGKNVGAVVQARYSVQEVEEHIQDYFSLRRASLTDLSHSVGPLLGRAQYISLRYAGAETLGAMEQLSHKGAAAPCVMLQYFKHKYAALGNDLLTRLVWQIYMFYYAPFLSIPGSLQYLEDAAGYVPNLTRLCRLKDWRGLQTAAVEFQDGFSAAVRRFLQKSVPAGPASGQVLFQWDSYRKPSQRCYSLAMELLLKIHQGIYPPGSVLPTLEQLANETGVSVSTVRRAQTLLASAGAIKGTSRVGTCVLTPAQAAACCDYTRPSIRRRLLDMLQSLQFLALSCRDVFQITIAALDAGGRARWKAKLNSILHGEEGGAAVISVMELIVLDAPFQTIRLVYAQLLRQMFWYNAFRSVEAHTKALDQCCLTCLERLVRGLEEPDPLPCSAALEAWMLHELRAGVRHLLQLGVPEADSVLIPQQG